MKRKICFLLALVMMTLSLSSLTVQAQTAEVCEVFADVKHEAWHEPSVQYVYDNGIMSGSNGTFKPQDNVTRGQLVTTLYRLAGEPEVTDESALEDFSDVVEGKYYTDAVCWAYANGIATGNNGKFDPTGKLTRQQMIVFLHRFAETMDIDVDNVPCGLSVIGTDLSRYATDAVLWALGNDLIVGNEVTVGGIVAYDVNPLSNATRAQVATILMRFCERYGV